MWFVSDQEARKRKDAAMPKQYRLYTYYWTNENWKHLLQPKFNWKIFNLVINCTIHCWLYINESFLNFRLNDRDGKTLEDIKEKFCKGKNKALQPC